MQVTMHSDPKAFLVRAAPFFESDPFSPSVIATVTSRIASGTLPSVGDHLWFTVEEDDVHVIGLSMHTPPHNMFLSRMPEDAALFLAREVALSGRNLPGVNGAIASTRAFARAWEQITGHSSTVLAETRMYRLIELLPPQAVPGDARLACSKRDVSLVADWLAAFHDEAQPHAPVDDWTAMAKRRISAEELHLWQRHGTPVAVAGVSRAVAGVARIGPVFTPPMWRGNGYGSSVTAAATSAALRAGTQHVVLYTDLANPTSNSIYQNIGYSADHDAEERTFDTWMGLRAEGAPGGESQTVATGLPHFAGTGFRLATPCDSALTSGKM
jgi:predicted GNAT family acetyltransferase